MTTLIEMLKATLGLGVVLAAWILVQTAWRRTFPDAVPEGEDVLAGRLSCHGCTCATPCEDKRRAEGEQSN